MTWVESQLRGMSLLDSLKVDQRRRPEGTFWFAEMEMRIGTRGVTAHVEADGDDRDDALNALLDNANRRAAHESGS